MLQINKRKNKILLLFLLIIIIAAGTAAYLYIFNIYEVTFSVSSKTLMADNKSISVIQAIPVNAFGWHVPFRTVIATYKVVEGKNLITIIKQDSVSGLLMIKANEEAGKVSIEAHSPKSLLTSIIDLIILPKRS